MAYTEAVKADLSRRAATSPFTIHVHDACVLATNEPNIAIKVPKALHTIDADATLAGLLRSALLLSHTLGEALAVQANWPGLGTVEVPNTVRRDTFESIAHPRAFAIIVVGAPLAFFAPTGITAVLAEFALVVADTCTRNDAGSPDTN